VAHITKADQAVPDHDNGPGKTKGFGDSLPPNQELQADRSMPLNLETIHSDPDDIVALGPQPNQEPNLDRGRTLNLEPIHLGLEDPVSLALQSSQEQQADSGWALNLEPIHLDLGDLLTLRLQPDHDLQADRGRKSNPDTIHSELYDTVMRSLRPVFALHLKRLHPIVVNTDETSATTLSDREFLEDMAAKMLPPTSPKLDDDDATGWKLVPFYGLALVFLVATVFLRQDILRVFQRDTFRPVSRSSLDVSGATLNQPLAHRQWHRLESKRTGEKW
jgi:hypothetical protein